MMSENKHCFCGLEKRYSDCCEPYHLNHKPAATAETLMRSRYSAYVLGNESYLLATWHQSTRPASLELDKESNTKWLGLKIVNTERGMSGDAEGTVEFVARYKINGKAHRLHEISRFVKEAGSWYYVGGDIQA